MGYPGFHVASQLRPGSGLLGLVGPRCVAPPRLWPPGSFPSSWCKTDKSCIPVCKFLPHFVLTGLCFGSGWSWILGLLISSSTVPTSTVSMQSPPAPVSSPPHGPPWSGPPVSRAARSSAGSRSHVKAPRSHARLHGPRRHRSRLTGRLIRSGLHAGRLTGPPHAWGSVHAGSRSMPRRSPVMAPRSAGSRSVHGHRRPGPGSVRRPGPGSAWVGAMATVSIPACVVIRRSAGSGLHRLHGPGSVMRSPGLVPFRVHAGHSLTVRRCPCKSAPPNSPVAGSRSPRRPAHGRRLRSTGSRSAGSRSTVRRSTVPPTVPAGQSCLGRHRHSLHRLKSPGSAGPLGPPAHGPAPRSPRQAHPVPSLHGAWVGWSPPAPVPPGSPPAHGPCVRRLTVSAPAHGPPAHGQPPVPTSRSVSAGSMAHRSGHLGRPGAGHRRVGFVLGVHAGSGLRRGRSSPGSTVPPMGLTVSAMGSTVPGLRRF
ncbi:atrophin-1-like [Haliotis rubra]|uniref:atrophin-1-like n=1 Tax=Haliotis rubra TaxID=36100 RepID=UPI001EE59ACF|nr:atrophin-1-like [Haliotis rubra]